MQNNNNKNIFITKNDEVKENYFKIVEKRNQQICQENNRQKEYIRYLEYILEQNKINYYRVNLL
jgi:hypothetical protein